MQWRINVLVFEQLCPGSAIRQQEGGTGILQPRICQSQCICQTGVPGHHTMHVCKQDNAG